MTKQLEALERVCDKRHTRMIQNGYSEQEAAQQVSLFLESWIEKWGKYPHLRHFAQALLEGYSLQFG